MNAGMPTPMPVPPSSLQPVRVGIIGFGFMGQTHLGAYRTLDGLGWRCPVLGVTSIDGTSGATSGPVGNLNNTTATLDAATTRYSTVEALLGDSRIEAVSVCTPTDTHVPLALQALRAGKHVLIEKPVALEASAIEAVQAAATEAKRVCMPAMCMRFWPGWTWLKSAIESGEFGRMRAATFQRLGSRPTWSRGFYGDPARCGGALADLHIHDADFVCWALGVPSTVRAVGTIDHVSVQFSIEGGPALVVAEGGWLADAGFDFRMRYTVEFERAVADWDLSRSPVLRLTRDGASAGIELPTMSAYEGEALEFLTAIREGREPKATLKEAAAVARVLEAERVSLARGGESVRVGQR